MSECFLRQNFYSSLDTFNIWHIGNITQKRQRTRCTPLRGNVPNSLKKTKKQLNYFQLQRTRGELTHTFTRRQSEPKGARGPRETDCLLIGWKLQSFEKSWRERTHTHTHGKHTMSSVIVRRRSQSLLTDWHNELNSSQHRELCLRGFFCAECWLVTCW